MNPLALVLILSGVFFVLFMIISGIFLMNKSPGTGGGSGSSSLFSTGSVGVIELNGAIMDSKKTLERLKRFEENSAVKSVVLRLNSPGGSVAPSQEIYEAVKKYKKPLVVSMASTAASGAFYIACGAKKVYANPGTITGSIGVIIQFANLEKLYQWAKIERYAIKTGKYKDAGAEYKPMSEEARGLFQEMIDEVLEQFKKAVAEGRKLPMEQVTAVADGRILTGSQAKKLKLVDELGTLQDAINDAAKQAGIKGTPNVIYPERKAFRILDFILNPPGDDDEDSEARAGSGGVLTVWMKRILGIPLDDSGLLAPAGWQMSPGVYWLWTGA